MLLVTQATPPQSPMGKIRATRTFEAEDSNKQKTYPLNQASNQLLIHNYFTKTETFGYLHAFNYCVPQPIEQHTSRDSVTFPATAGHPISGHHYNPSAHKYQTGDLFTSESTSNTILYPQAHYNQKYQKHFASHTHPIKTGIQTNTHPIQKGRQANIQTFFTKAILAQHNVSQVPSVPISVHVPTWNQDSESTIQPETPASPLTFNSTTKVFPPCDLITLLAGTSYSPPKTPYKTPVSTPTHNTPTDVHGTPDSTEPTNVFISHHEFLILNRIDSQKDIKMQQRYQQLYKDFNSCFYLNCTFPDKFYQGSYFSQCYGVIQPIIHQLYTLRLQLVPVQAYSIVSVTYYFKIFPIVLLFAYK